MRPGSRLRANMKKNEWLFFLLLFYKMYFLQSRNIFFAFVWIPFLWYTRRMAFAYKGPFFFICGLWDFSVHHIFFFVYVIKHQKFVILTKNFLCPKNVFREFNIIIYEICVDMTVVIIVAGWVEEFFFSRWCWEKSFDSWLK